MESPFLASCLDGLGAPADGGLPGLLSRTSFDRFALLQTPGLWGHDPTDSASRTSLPPASVRLLGAIEEVIASAGRIVDIATLEPFPSGDFMAAIRRGLARCGDRPVTVRILLGRHRFTPHAEADFADFLRHLTVGLPSDSRLQIHACRMETSNHPTSPSWNHAKIVAVDGREAIVGGHNLWHADYLGAAPVHDVSGRITGRAASEAHRFLDHLWDWVAGQLDTPSATGSVSVLRAIGGSVAAAVPPQRVTLEPVAAGAIPALAVGRLGAGVLADPRLANVGAALAAVAFRRARSRIRISQMDFGFHWDGVNFWSADVVAALADGLTDPNRRIDVSLVLSEPGAKTAAGGPYSFGTTIADIVSEMRRAMGHRPRTGRMRIAPLRISPVGDRWYDGNEGLKLINHAKLWIIDDIAFHVGSDNLYPHNLQEFGYLIESEFLVNELATSYWEPLWGSSSRAAVDV